MKVTDKRNRNEYAYVIAVKDRIEKVIAIWWGTEEEMKICASAMAASARYFKKTASIIVYAKHDDEKFHFEHSCERSQKLFISETLNNE